MHRLNLKAEFLIMEKSIYECKLKFRSQLSGNIINFHQMKTPLNFNLI